MIIFNKWIEYIFPFKETRHNNYKQASKEEENDDDLKGINDG